MSLSRRRAPRASRPFVTAPYELVGGCMWPVLPTRGPCGCQGSECCIKIHHLRERKTGIPWGYLAFVTCSVHGKSCTLYPPGHVPYGRTSFVRLGPDGSALEQGEGEEACPPSSGYFDAAEDAAAGERWAVDTSPNPPDAVRSTQRRRLARAEGILGLDEHLPLGPEAVAEVTHLPQGELLEVVKRLALTRDLVARGREVRDLVAGVARLAGRALMDRLAVLGHLAGLWGHPYRWRPSASALLELGRPFWREGPFGTTAGCAPPGAGENFNNFGPGPPV